MNCIVSFCTVEGVNLDISIAAHAFAYVKDRGLCQGIVGPESSLFDAESHGYVYLPC